MDDEGDTVGGPEKRLPGQSNRDYRKHGDPNADFLGQHSLEGRGSTTTLVSLLRRWLDSRRRKRTGGR